MKLAFWRPSLSPLQEQLQGKLTALDDQLTAKLLEYIDLTANYVDPRERYYDPSGTVWKQLGSGGAEDQSPTDYSRLTNEQDLTAVRDYCRNLAAENPFAINLHENMVNYIAGDGDKPTIVAQKGEEIDDGNLKAMQEVLDEWMYENHWVTRQQESVRRFDRDGEFFRRYFRGEDGNLSIRFVEPNLVTQPPSHPEKHNAFGIQTDPDDVETVIGYWVDGENVPAEEIQHVKANVDLNVRRGVPTTWPIGEMLKRACSVLENIAVTSQIQTAIALIRRHENGTAAGATSMRTSASAFSRTDSRTGKTDYIQNRKKGQIIDAPAGIEYDFPASGLDVEKYGAGVQAILRGAAARVCFPEFMFTSDASNANYASTMVAEGPAVRMFQRRQRLQRDADLEVLWKVLEYKAEAGLIDGSLLERIEIMTEPPRVQVRDEKAFADTNKILADAKILSPQTWSAKSGLDYEQEQSNIEKHQESHPGQMQQAEIDVLKAKAVGGDALQQADRAARMEAVEAYLGG